MNKISAIFNQMLRLKLVIRFFFYATFLLLFVSFFQLTPDVSEGIASFYHIKFNGRKTASGELFSNDSLTAAHKSLPFGTRIKVKNLKNDSVIFVRVNDRLPLSSKRLIDVSQSVAKKLNFFSAGITRVKIEVVK